MDKQVEKEARLMHEIFSRGQESFPARVKFVATFVPEWVVWIALLLLYPLRGVAPHGQDPGRPRVPFSAPAAHAHLVMQGVLDGGGRKCCQAE